MKEYSVTFKVRFQGQPRDEDARLAILSAINTPAAQASLKHWGAERSEATITAVPQITADLPALVEDSWTCRCSKCGVKSFHDSDVNAGCIKGRKMCDGYMQGRVAIDFEARR